MKTTAVFLLLLASCGGSGPKIARTQSVRYCEVYIDAGGGQYYYVPGFVLLDGFDSQDRLVYRRFRDEWGFTAFDEIADSLFDEWVAQGGDPLRVLCDPAPVEELADFEVFLYDFSIGGYVGPADYARFVAEHARKTYIER